MFRRLLCPSIASRIMLGRGRSPSALRCNRLKLRFSVISLVSIWPLIASRRRSRSAFDGAETSFDIVRTTLLCTDFFCILRCLCRRCGASTNDSGNPVTSCRSVSPSDSQNNASIIRMRSGRQIAVFVGTVVLVILLNVVNVSFLVREHIRRILQRNPMLFQVLCRLILVPFEVLVELHPLAQETQRNDTTFIGSSQEAD